MCWRYTLFITDIHSLLVILIRPRFIYNHHYVRYYIMKGGVGLNLLTAIQQQDFLKSAHLKSKNQLFYRIGEKGCDIFCD